MVTEGSSWCFLTAWGSISAGGWELYLLLKPLLIERGKHKPHRPGRQEKGWELSLTEHINTVNKVGFEGYYAWPLRPAVQGLPWHRMPTGGIKDCCFYRWKGSTFTSQIWAGGKICSRNKHPLAQSKNMGQDSFPLTPVQCSSAGIAQAAWGQRWLCGTFVCSRVRSGGVYTCVLLSHGCGCVYSSHCYERLPWILYDTMQTKGASKLGHLQMEIEPWAKDLKCNPASLQSMTLSTQSCSSCWRLFIFISVHMLLWLQEAEVCMCSAAEPLLSKQSLNVRVWYVWVCVSNGLQDWPSMKIWGNLWMGRN